MLWRVLTVTLSVHDADTRGKARTHVWRNQTLQIVSSVILTEDQCIQLATPSYKLKKEKREAKKLEASSTLSNLDNASLVDLATVSVIIAVNEQGALQSPSESEPSSKKPKKDKPTTSKTKTVKSESKSATETKIAELNQKWLDRFNRLEVLLVARSLELTFSSTVEVTPTHSPPAGAYQADTTSYCLFRVSWN